MALELELKKLGFSDKEARVYLALLELGSAAVQDIAQKAKVNRATTYVVLDKLAKDGIVSTVEQGKKTHFAAESPRTLSRLFRTQEQELKDKQNEFRKVLPELDAVFSLTAERPAVRFFEGIDGVRTVREEILNSGAKIIYDIYSFDHVEQAKTLLSAEEDNEFRKKRTELGIAIRSIYTREAGPCSEFLTAGERKFVPKDRFPFSCDILIYGDKVALTTLHKKIITVIIESKEIVDTMRLVFELAWLGADHV